MPLPNWLRPLTSTGFFRHPEQWWAEFRGKLDAVRPGIVLESEGAPPFESIQGHHMSWAQGFPDSFTPGILRNKWLERRHMQHQIRRWDRDHTGELRVHIDEWKRHDGVGERVWHMGGVEPHATSPSLEPCCPFSAGTSSSLPEKDGRPWFRRRPPIYYLPVCGRTEAASCEFGR